MWVTARNLHLADSFPSVRAIRKVTMDTASHARSRRMAESAHMHRVTARKRAQHMPEYLGVYPWPEWDMWVMTIRKTTDDTDMKMEPSWSKETA